MTGNILHVAKRGWKLIPVAVPSKACVWSLLKAEIVGLNPADGVDICLYVFFFVFCEGSGLCNELITRADELYRVCVSKCV